MFTGVVLTGGRSSRMGTDKALVEVGGRPLALIAADALRTAGADRVVAVGGDRERLEALGLEVHPDDHPGEGPLGAIVTALGLGLGLGLGGVASHPADGSGDIVMVVACDMPTIDAETLATVVAALAAHPDAEGAVPVLDGRRQILTAAYRRRLRPQLAAAFAAGERAPRRALERVRIVEVGGIDPDRLADVDRPADLHRYAHPHTRTSPADAAPPERIPLSVPEIDVEALAELHAAGATIVDVRQPDEYEDAHVPGAILIPLGDVQERVAEIPTGGPVYVICRSGARSMRASEWLVTQDIEATNIAGGTMAWIDSGRPVVTGGAPG